jgi:light-regulated signal transduction histidine kinase (bacteriophytochrome)
MNKDDTVAHQKVELLRQELADLIYKISHDLNAPLRGIDGYAERIKEEDGEHLSNKSKTYLEEIQSSSRQTSGILRGILNLSRINTRQSEYEMVDFNELVKELLYEREMFESVRENTQCIVGKLPVVSCDRGHVTQALSALIENAFLYKLENKENFVKIDCSIDDKWARINVSDEGIGIETRYIDEVVKPLTRLVAQREYPGFGIGLALADKVMQRHSGRLEIRSKLEHGTTVSLIFPIIL